MRRLVLLGSTGSIGAQALDVVRRNADRFEVVGLAAAQSHELLVGQIREFLPPVVAVTDERAAAELREALAGLRRVEVIAGVDAGERLARGPHPDMGVKALGGAVGLGPTLA